MAYFDYNKEKITKELMPSILRNERLLSFINVLCEPVKRVHDLVFIDYKAGSTYPNYNNLTSYVQFDKVIYTDNKVYECIANTTGNNPLDTNYWVLINENFIGTDERAKYNSQIIVLERALNRWFRNESSATQIYIGTNNITPTAFVMGQTGQYSSVMPVNSVGAVSAMGVAPTFSNQYNFTIYFPSALFSSIGTNLANRENRIRIFVNKYIVAGTTYNITTY